MYKPAWAVISPTHPTFNNNKRQLQKQNDNNHCVSQCFGHNYWHDAVEEITENSLELEASLNSIPVRVKKLHFCIRLNGTCKLYRPPAFNILTLFANFVLSWKSMKLVASKKSWS